MSVLMKSTVVPFLNVICMWEWYEIVILFLGFLWNHLSYASFKYDNAENEQGNLYICLVKIGAVPPLRVAK